MTNRFGAGFSYIELLVCTVLIGVAYVVMFGAGSKFGQERRKADCASQLARLYLPLTLYASEHDGAYPVVPGATASEAPLSELVPRYTTDTSLFICPGSRNAALPGAQPFADRRISYAYYMGLTRDAPAAAPLLSDAQVDSHQKHCGDALFSTAKRGPGTNHRSYGGNVLFADGHVEPGGAVAMRDLLIPAGVVLLNPKP